MRVLVEDNVNKVDWLRENRPNARMSDDFMFRSVIRVTCFRFIWPGKVSTMFSLGREDVFSRIRVQYLFTSYARHTRMEANARAIEETGMIRQGMLRYRGNQMWLITEYIINFKRTELNEVQSREVIEVYAESSTTNRSLRFQGFKHCERDSRMLFHWSEQGRRSRIRYVSHKVLQFKSQFVILILLIAC